MNQSKLILYLFLLILSAVVTLPAQTTPTYQIGNTTYLAGEYYETGYPKVERNISVRNEFLRSLGYDRVPEGYEVDHIIPLSQGGKDEVWNMQLLTKEQHRRKTARERANASYHYQLPVVPDANTSYSSPLRQSPSGNSTTTPGRTIYTGPRGGQYYINSNGNKTYLKSSGASSGSGGLYSSPGTGTGSSSGRVIHTGPRGGRYYINSNGNKTYIKGN